MKFDIDLWLLRAPRTHSLNESTAELYSTSHADTTTDKPFSPGLSVHVEVSMLNGLRPQTAAHGERERGRQREREMGPLSTVRFRYAGAAIVLCCVVSHDFATFTYSVMS